MLTRFGGGGQLRLRCDARDEIAEILFELTDAPEVPTGSHVETPAFLRLLLERFAERVGAKTVLEQVESGVPRSAGLRWPISALVSAS